ncbi:MAG: hydantoinase/oxoprolinase family protein [Candidatus Heimdallarchaeaceae archaeon]
MYIIGIDTGGTFTDFILYSEKDKRIRTWKSPTTPTDPSVGIIKGLKQLMEHFDFSAEEIKLILHGTTIGTNAFLEGKTPKIAFLITRGFRDIIEIGRQQRSELYNLKFQENYPIAFEKDLILEVEERVNSDGSIIKPLEKSSLNEIVSEVKSHNITTVAISLLFSFTNPQHEELIAQYLREIGFDVFCSYELAPQIREYERSVTTIINAKISPVVKEYLTKLQNRLSQMGIEAPLLIMQSNTGLSDVMTIATRGIQTLYSGLAAGVLAASATSKHQNVSHVISLDIGGTSTDVSAFINEPVVLRSKTFHGFPLLTAMVDIETIGAGGGSIAYFKDGILKVGPQSQGANPGPACYSLGGDKVTLTDANLLLGYLDKSNFAGDLDIDIGKSRLVLNNLLREIKTSDYPIDINSITELSYAIRRILNHNVALAIRKVTIQRGLDPRDFTLIAFGGAGPLHGWDIAKELSIPKVIVPPYPGVWSAFGLICSDIRHEKTVSYLKNITELNIQELNNNLLEVTAELQNVLSNEGVEKVRQKFRYSVDMRYLGQAYSLTLPINYPMTKDNLSKVTASFHKLHERMYAWYDTSLPVEIVNFSVESIGLMPKMWIKQLPKGNAHVNAEAYETERKIYFDGEWMSTPVIRKELLKANNIIEGPYVINQLDTTIVIPPNVRACVDNFGYILLEEIK